MKYTKQEAKILRQKFLISQSFIKELTDRQGNEIPICPAFLGKTYILKSEPKPDRETWKEGRLMEQLMIGGSSSHSKNENNELERKQPNKRQKALGQKGDMKLKEIRIRQQAKNFKILAKKAEWEYFKENTQVRIIKNLNTNKDITKSKLFAGEIDWGPIPVKTSSFGDTIMLCDIKHSANLDSDFGPYAWKHDEYVDKIQADSYLEMIKDIDWELNDIIQPEHNIREAFAFCGYKLLELQDNKLASELDPKNLSLEERDMLISLTENLINKGNINFLYWIFDSSPEMRVMKVFREQDKITKFEYKERLRTAINITNEIIDYYNKHKEFEEILNPVTCKGCHIKHCKARDNNEYLY